MFSPGLVVSNRVVRGQQTPSILKSIPSPYGGWNARDAKSEMAPTDAIVLDNWVPGEQGCQQRRGFAVHATGLTGNFVESLIPYNKAGETAKLFAAADTRIFDVTVAGTATAVVTGLTNARWQHTMFGTPGGHFLVICNGADSVRNWDGTSWTTPVITSATSSTFINVCVHNTRLWFVENNSLKIHYLPVQSVAGAAKQINLSEHCELGGKLMAMASWSRDGGSGPDDYAVFITSEGQVLVYGGNDPDDAATWGLVGKFNGPKPIGHRCLIKLGADLCLLSNQGLLPLPQYLGRSSAALKGTSLTEKISGAFRSAVRSGGSNYGWQVIEYPKENLLIINVPITERSEQHQYIVNLATGACARFKGMNAGCWALKGDDLYFGGNNGKVYAYGGSSVYSDDSAPVTTLAIQAFQNFGTTRQKHFKMARPLISGPEGYAPGVSMLLDYNSETLPTFDPPNFEAIGPFWDEELWDTALWSSGLVVSNLWQGINGTGVTGAIAVSSQVTTALIWNQTDILFETGGVL